MGTANVIYFYAERRLTLVGTVYFYTKGNSCGDAGMLYFDAKGNSCGDGGRYILLC